MSFHSQELEQAAVPLFLSHPVYGPLTVAQTREAVARLLGEVRAMVEAGTVMVEQPPPPPLGAREEHYFAKHGPQCRTSYCVLAPDSSLLSPSLLALGRKKDMETLLCLAYDPEQRCGVGAEREEPISLRAWLQHRLSHVVPGGPGDSYYFLLTMFVYLEVKKIQSKFGDEGGTGRWGELARFPGTTDYYSRLQSGLLRAVEWLGAPTHLVSVSMNIFTSRCLATWVSLTQGSQERPVRVWRREDELQHLTPLSDNLELEEGGEYFTHTRKDVEGQEGSVCPFHQDCRRQPLEDWRAR